MDWRIGDGLGGACVTDVAPIDVSPRNGDVAQFLALPLNSSGWQLDLWATRFSAGLCGGVEEAPISILINA